MNKDFLRKYAELIVKMGVNIQTNQILVLRAPIESAEFVRMITEIAYKNGARDVIVKWADELSTKIRFQNANNEVFDEFPEYEKDFYLTLVRKGAAFLSISASDPDLMKDVETSKIVRTQKAANSQLTEYRDRLMNNVNIWCVASIPTAGWAKKVFPDVSASEAIEKLWEAIFKAVRADREDPVVAWEKHDEKLKDYKKLLNDYNFDKLIIKNELGTNVEIELPEGHIWYGGSADSSEGTRFFPNMPTEEIFSMPKKTGVNGKVVSALPLNLHGSLVEDFTLTFKDGRIVDFDAKIGYEQLKGLIETDEGSHYLGEVALVPYDSPISNSKILFFNTLFDENASCHLAIGKAYPICIENGDKLTKEEMEEKGVNDSLTHVDFMFGTSDLTIDGVTKDGKVVQVFKNGNYAL